MPNYKIVATMECGVEWGFGHSRLVKYKVFILDERLKSGLRPIRSSSSCLSKCVTHTLPVGFPTAATSPKSTHIYKICWIFLPFAFWSLGYV